ncbi:MAG: bifunctional chorismate mutase/prephenate dehydratase [Lachnospiraceae bacterium]|nr:bifunctional chorismate mutase/prephenate dehydratase [Lachnospiraceae bacterium]
MENRCIAYSGIPGAYAAIAASKIFPGEELKPYPSFAAVFDAVSKGECGRGVLPIENSYAGDVSQVMDLLYFGELYIHGIYELPIYHNLLAVKGASLEDIKCVTSHPQALDQCAGFIEKGKLMRKEAVNTAVAAREVAERADISVAAIASTETAEIYGLDILARNINESDDNATRFAVVSGRKEPEDAVREAFSMILIVKNEAGAFAKAITAIGDNGFNMRAIRSRPMKSLPWNYYFYVEGEGDLESEAGRKMIKDLEPSCEKVRILGNYAGERVL